jgi:hypothetical protein
MGCLMLQLRQPFLLDYLLTNAAYSFPDEACRVDQKTPVYVDKYDNNSYNIIKRF